MGDLPVGTVTFLFSDIEGSTRLLQALGERYPAVRDRHAAVVRRAIADHAGVEVNTAGDSFFVVFTSALEALRAATDVQRGLAAQPWEGASLRVRIGVHTGRGVLGGEDYVGIDVHRAARIAGAGHGGQVLLSEATRALVEHALPDGLSLRDLGVHRLKDIERPERLFDVVIDGLQSEFPPLKTVDARPTNLTQPLTSFVGREADVEQILELLGRSRLLTLTGPGGAGKTRLALHIAARLLSEFADGVFLIDLSPISDPELVPSAIAHTLGVAEDPARPVVDALREHLRPRAALLVMDNFEQVVDAAPVVEDLLVAAVNVKILVTSRVVLGLRGEQEYPVPPLDVPNGNRPASAADLERFAAVRLFVERAHDVDPRFALTEANAAAVAAITTRLDGLPLAIELAATRAKVLAPAQMLPRLERSLSILTAGARTLPERQRTLRDTIAWSFDLLDEAGRRLFAQLSAFVGGWSLEAAEAVCDPANGGGGPAAGNDPVATLDGLASLVDQSLVRRGEGVDGSVRFSMLETIREFAEARLAEMPDAAEVRRRHAGWFLELALAAEAHLTAEDQGVWLDRCDEDHANIRAALGWAVDRGDADRAQEAAGALWRFWQQRGHLAEARRWFDQILAMPTGGAPTAARAKALSGAGGIAWWQQDVAAARSFYGEALSVARQVGDSSRLAAALYDQAFVVAADGDLDGAGVLLQESLEAHRRIGDDRGVAQVLVMLVIGDANVGDWAAVAARLEEAAAIMRRLGNRLDLAFDLIWLALAYGRLGRERDARTAALEALGLFRDVKNQTGVALAFRDLAFLATWAGRHQDAIRLAAASEAIRVRIGGGPPAGFAGLLEGDPAVGARRHLPAAVAEAAWNEGLALSEDEAAALADRDAGPGAPVAESPV